MLLITRSPGLFVTKPRHFSDTVTCKIFLKSCPSCPFHLSILNQIIFMIHLVFSLFIWNSSVYTSTRQPIACRLDTTYKNSESNQQQRNYSDSSHPPSPRLPYFCFLSCGSAGQRALVWDVHISHHLHFKIFLHEHVAAALQLKTERKY